MLEKAHIMILFFHRVHPSSTIAYGRHLLSSISWRIYADSISHASIWSHLKIQKQPNAQVLLETTDRSHHPGIRISVGSPNPLGPAVKVTEVTGCASLLDMHLRLFA